MDYLATKPRFNSLSIIDLLRARDQFHAHLLHKENVVGTAIGRYLIRNTDPYPKKDTVAKETRRTTKEPRTLENSEVRDYSWPCILVFVSEWVEESAFGAGRELPASSFIPKSIYMEDGRVVPICVVLAPIVERRAASRKPKEPKLPGAKISGGFPVQCTVQGVTHTASLGCIVTDGHALYALTSRHVTGKPGGVLASSSGDPIGRSSDKQIGRMPFEQVYQSWPGKNIYVNVDVGLIELDDQTRWSGSIYGIGRPGPLADLSIHNLTLDMIGCPVQAYGAISGRLSGSIAALFYRYRSVGGLEYVADFLIGSRDERPLQTHPGDSGTVWVMESDDAPHDSMPIAIQWGGTVFSGESASMPFALATNLSTVCRELNVDVFRSRELASFEYWESVGHYTIGSFACSQVADQNLRKLMTANIERVGFQIGDIDAGVNSVTVPGFVPLANVPDKVWKKSKSGASVQYGRKPLENPNHYANIDFEDDDGETLDSLTSTAANLNPERWRQYYKRVGWNQVSQRGLLPFRVWQIYKGMVQFVSDGDIARFVAAAGVLAHYVGDACQTLHGSYLTNGDPFRFPDGSPSNSMLGLGEGYGGGIHGAYEGEMLDDNLDDFLPMLEAELGSSHGMQRVKGGRNAGYAAIKLMRRTRRRIKPMDLVEIYGRLKANGEANTAAQVLWADFGEQTVKAVADGCRTLAMIWESAWIEGGGAAIPQAQLKAISESRLKTIYKDQTFLPSKALGQIDAFL